MLRGERRGCKPVNGHAIVTPLDAYDFDAVIRNDGSFKNLESAVDEIMTRLRAQARPSRAGSASTDHEPPAQER